MNPVTLEVLLERKHPGMAAFVVVPASAVEAWGLSMTTTVEGALDGIPLGRRSLHRWDADRWFVELRKETLQVTGKGPGDRATLTISLASPDLPAELQALIDSVPEARARWEAHTPAQQRMLREEILAAKSAATRERRARRALLPAGGGGQTQKRAPVSRGPRSSQRRRALSGPESWLRWSAA